MSTLFEQIQAVNNQVSDIKLIHEDITVVYYQHKTEPDKSFTDLHEAFKNGLNLSEYEEKTKIFSLKEKLRNEIFEGKIKYYSENPNSVFTTTIGTIPDKVNKFLNIVKELCKFEPVVKVKTPFEIGLSKINGEIQNLKKKSISEAEKAIELKALEAKRIDWYAKEGNGKVYKPRGTKTIESNIKPTTGKANKPTPSILDVLKD